MSTLLSPKKKMESPSAERNKEPIWNVLLQEHVLDAKDGDDSLRILEIAAGSGVHTKYFLQQLQQKQPPRVVVTYIPTDPEISSLESIQAHLQEVELLPATTTEKIMVQEPLELTLNKQGIAQETTQQTLLPHKNTMDLVLCINMIHISPWEATCGLMQTAAQMLRPGGFLYCYGAYRVGDQEMVESNKAFDRSLKMRNPEWGIRNLEDVVALANEAGLEHHKTIEMPANNLSVLYRKKAN